MVSFIVVHPCRDVLRRTCATDTLVLAKQLVSGVVFKRSLQRNIKFEAAQTCGPVSGLFQSCMIKGQGDVGT